MNLQKEKHRKVYEVLKNQDIKSDYVINAILFFEEYKDIDSTEIIMNRKYKELYEKTWALLENTMMSFAQSSKTPSFPVVSMPVSSPTENQKPSEEAPKEEPKLTEKEKKDKEIREISESDELDSLIDGLDAWS